MTYVEELGVKQLDEFIANAEGMGISYGGIYNGQRWDSTDIDKSVQEMVINIVKDYVHQYKTEVV